MAYRIKGAKLFHVLKLELCLIPVSIIANLNNRNGMYVYGLNFHADNYVTAAAINSLEEFAHKLN